MVLHDPLSLRHFTPARFSEKSILLNAIVYIRIKFLYMNLHEYQAKELLKKYNVPVQEGFACSTVHEVEDAYRQIKTETGSKFAVVKAQIHAGGRGKGTVKETGING